MMRCECGDYEIERSVDYLLDMKAVWHARGACGKNPQVRAEKAEAQVRAVREERDRLANQLVNEIPGSYIQMKERALRAEAAIERVRELCEDKSREVAMSDPLFGPPSTLAVTDILRALDGDSDE